MKLLRDDLLDGRTIALPDGSAWLRQRLEGLGAQVVAPAPPEDRVGDVDVRLDALICDVAFGSGSEPLLAIDACWPVIRDVAAEQLIPRAETGGVRKIVLLGPRPGGGEHAEAARAALENLARTLSVEWARYSITVTMIAPGALTSAEEVGTIVAFLCSRAGDYYTGCRFSLGSVTGPR